MHIWAHPLNVGHFQPETGLALRRPIDKEVPGLTG
jgi:hypothetical protein